MNYLDIFVESLKAIMEDNEMKDIDLARKLGYDKSVISRWLSKSYYPNPRSLIKISDVFNISTDYLFGLSDTKSLNRENVSTTFFERYTHLKSSAKVNDYKVSTECDIGTGIISGWKKIKFSPETETLLKLAKFFDCSMDFLLGLKTTKSKQS